METTYNRLAGQNVERLSALSDGVFAFAMTLLAVDLHTPVSAAIHGEGKLWEALAALGPQIVSYLMSFITLGIFWNGQEAQFRQFSRSNRHLTWIHLAFLFFVTLLPFSTRLLAEFIAYRTALLLYWANILLLGLVLYASWAYARCAGLLNEDTTPAIDKAVRRRIAIAQALYAAGAALCLVNTWVSIAAIIAVQLNYADRADVSRPPVKGFGMRRQSHHAGPYPRRGNTCRFSVSSRRRVFLQGETTGVSTDRSYWVASGFPVLNGIRK